MANERKSNGYFLLHDIFCFSSAIRNFELEMHDGTRTKIHTIIDLTEKGLVLFAYPKANTPGRFREERCVCMRRCCLYY